MSHIKKLMEFKQKMIVSGVAHSLYPTHLLFGVVYLQDGTVTEIPPKLPFKGDWGQITSVHLLEESSCLSFPEYIDIVYLSVVEGIYYGLTKRISVETINAIATKYKKSVDEISFLVGMAPYGYLALWIITEQKSIIVGWYHGEEVEVTKDDFLPNEQFVKADILCSKYLCQNVVAYNNLKKNGLPHLDTFNNYMKQFMYRYIIHFERDNSEIGKAESSLQPDLKYIEESLYDGTHDKLHDDGLLKYHQAGKPKKLAIKWNIGKSEYSAYFWFEEEPIREVFDKFYGAHPDTKTDFIIHIDAENRKYELALYRYGLKEPQVIPETVYQLLVFKNKFEDYRSDNYNQERGAWIW